MESTTSTEELNLSPAAALALRFANTDMVAVSLALDVPVGTTMSPSVVERVPSDAIG